MASTNCQDVNISADKINGSSNTSHRNASWKDELDKSTTIDLRKKHIGPSLQIFFPSDPLKIVRGEGQYMFDEMGKKYLDCVNNVAHVGHCHPYVVAACHNQMSVLNTNSRFLHDNMVQLARRITATLPSQLSVCYFVNSGSEANDLALRLARYFTKRKDTIVLNHAYHGHLTSTIAISPYKTDHDNCDDEKPDWVHVVPVPDPYRGKYRDDVIDDAEKLANLYADEVKDVCQRLVEEKKGVSMFFAESMQGCGGQVVFPPGYLRLAYKYVREAGGICLADEVQTGFGRIGKHMWAFQSEGNDIIPDIVTMGKAMGNGFPVSAVVTTREIADAFRRGPDYFNTFGGSPVACAVALSVLDVMENENLRENAVTISNYLLNEFELLKQRHPLIGQIRGIGMFIGIDLIKSHKTREPATKEAEFILWKLRFAGIILTVDGPFSNILKFKPPMCFNKDDAIFLVSKLDPILSETEQNFGY